MKLISNLKLTKINFNWIHLLSIAFSITVLHCYTFDGEGPVFFIKDFNISYILIFV